jgi:hypothetical protein
MLQTTQVIYRVVVIVRCGLSDRLIALILRMSWLLTSTYYFMAYPGISKID